MIDKNGKPAQDSQFRLIPCRSCKNDNAVYQERVTGGKKNYRVKCLGCGQRTPWWPCRHDAQIDWNSRFGECGKHFLRTAETQDGAAELI